MAQLGIRQGAHNNKGGEFEVKILTLLFVRAQRRGVKFRLTKNLDCCGVWDDVVFQEKNGTTYFLQLKHRENRLSLSTISFLNPREDFDLKELFHSYCQVRNNFVNKVNHDIFRNVSLENVKFLLYTNGVFKTKHLLNEGVQAGNHILNSNALNGYIFSFNRNCETDKYINNLFNEIVFCSLELSKIITENGNSSSLGSDMINRIVFLKSKLKTGTVKYELDSLLKEPTETKLRRIWQNLGDINNIEEFLGRFSVMDGQCSEHELDVVIMKEIEEIFGTKRMETEALFGEVKNYIVKWWRNETSDNILDENSLFWKTIVQARTNRVEKFCLDTKWPLSFQDVSVLKEKIPRDGSIIVCTECIKITCIKLKQALQGSTSMLVDVATLQLQSEEITALWPTYWCEVLLVQCVNARNVMKYLGQNARGTLIIICNNEIKVAFKDTVILSDFDFHSQHVILQQKVKFQGHLVEFGSLLKNIQLFDRVNGTVIEQCLEGQLKIGRELVTFDKNFIQRSLSTECCSKSRLNFGINVLVTGETKIPDICYYLLMQTYTELISKTTKIMLLFLKVDYCQQLIKKRFSLDWPENVYAEARYMQLHEDVLIILIKYWDNQNQVVEAIQEIFPDIKVKWFINRNYLLATTNWVQVKPGWVLEDIEQFGLQVDSIEGALKLQMERVVLLVAGPGMGKSTYFTHLAHIFKAYLALTWIVHIKWSQHTQLLHEMKVIDKWSAIDFVWRAYIAGCQCSVFEEMFFKYSLEQGLPHFALLLDGFDEVCPTYTEKAVTLLKVLYSETQVKNLWISTRPVVKEVLLQNLDAMCVALTPLNAVQSLLLLHLIWHEKSERACQLIKHIEKSELQDIQRNYKRYESDGSLSSFVFSLDCNQMEMPFDFLKVPLHVYMISVALENFMIVSCCSKYIYLPLKLNFLHLYEKFMKVKMNIYLVEKSGGDMTKPTLQNECDDIINRVMDTHMIVALYSLFGSKFLHTLHDKQIEVKALDIIRNFEEVKETKGIIAQVSGGTVYFVHHTFAEYFAAQWFARNFKENRGVLQSILFQKEYCYLLAMFDHIFCQGFALHEAIMNLAMGDIHKLSSNTELLNLVDRGGRTPLHLSVIHGIFFGGPQQNSRHLFPVNVLTSKGAKVHVFDDVLEYTPIQYAYMCHKWEAVHLLLTAEREHVPACFLNTLQKYGSMIVSNTSSLPGVSRSLLNVAVTLGDFSEVQQLIETGADVNFQEEPGLTLLHLAVWYNHLSLVILLVEDYKADVNVQHPKLGTPYKLALFLLSYFSRKKELNVKRKKNLHVKRDGSKASIAYAYLMSRCNCAWLIAHYLHGKSA